MITKSELQKNAFKFKRKKQRKNIIKGLKGLERIIQQESKTGRMYHSFSHDKNSDAIFWVEPAFRLFMLKHKGLQCRILKNSEYTYFEISWG